MAIQEQDREINEGNKQIAKEIMIAYINKVDPTAAGLFTKSDNAAMHFEAIWDRIFKKVSAQDQQIS